MKAYNLMKISFYSRSVNEGFAVGRWRASGSGGPHCAELADMKTAVSEAVTNCIVMPIPSRWGWST